MIFSVTLFVLLASMRSEHKNSHRSLWSSPDAFFSLSKLLYISFLSLEDPLNPVKQQNLEMEAARVWYSWKRMKTLTTKLLVSPFRLLNCTADWRKTVFSSNHDSPASFWNIQACRRLCRLQIAMKKETSGQMFPNAALEHDSKHFS